MCFINATKGSNTESLFWDSRKPEYIIFAVFLIFYCIITVFHEPWFDEAQVWQIGRCASLHDLLFEVPHYEGHPAFWSMILAIPAKLGAPFEISLKLFGFIISASSVYVILFKTKFPRLMKLILPFTYFVFYQYGVIVRPYGLMLLFFLLLAIVFPERREKPWKFVIFLMLLCLTSAYAILMAGGIAICFTWEILSEKGAKRFFKELFVDTRTLLLFALLFLAILLALQIMPREDTFVTSKSDNSNSFLLCLIISVFTFIGESTITTGSWFAQDTIGLQQVAVNIAELSAFVVLGIIIWIIIIGASSKKTLKYLIVPYLMLSVFASLVYFSVHHVGVVYLLLLFWLEILMQDANRYEIGRTIIAKIAQNERDEKLLTYPVIIVFFACLVIPVYWNVAACIIDIEAEYCPGRSAATWIREHALENNNFMSVWGQGDPSNELLYNNTNLVGLPVVINPYFERNISMNLNFGRDDEGYMHYRISTKDENTKALQNWKSNGAPDILLGKVRLEEVFGDEVSYDDYAVVNLFLSNRIWKNQKSSSKIPVFARNAILEDHNLEPLVNQGLEYYMNGLQITEEMIEQLENGVPAEEVLKPYLDAMFGEEE